MIEKNLEENPVARARALDSANATACSPMEMVTDVALESMHELISGKMENGDLDAKPVLKRLLDYVELIQSADASYYEVMNKIVEMEFELIEQLGYSYSKGRDGTLVFYDVEDTDSSLAGTDGNAKPLTEADYYTVMDYLHEDFRTNGVPDDLKPAFNRMKNILSRLLAEETHFGLAMAQARPYLSDIEGMFCITRYYSNMSLLNSLRAMFDPVR